MLKAKRQAKILEIISTTNVETQEQLLQALQEAGFTSTQATISRDIKELNLAKMITEDGKYKYTAAPATPRLPGRFPAPFPTG